MRVVFLDIDGVLNSVGFRPENPQGLRDWLSETNVRALRRIVESTGAAIVLTSSWRITMAIEEIASALSDRGVHVNIIGSTPSLAPGSRAAEIALWLRSTDLRVEAWIAVDDDWIGAGDQYFRVSKISGLTDADADEISRLLNREQG